MPQKKRTGPTVISSKLALIKCYLDTSDDDSEEDFTQSRTLKRKESTTATRNLLRSEEKRQATGAGKTKPDEHNKKVPSNKVKSIQLSQSQESSETASDEQSVHLSSEEEPVKWQKDFLKAKLQRQPLQVTGHSAVLKDPPAVRRANNEDQPARDDARPKAAAVSAKPSRRQFSASAGSRGRVVEAPVSRYASARSVKMMHLARSPSAHAEGHKRTGSRSDRMQTNYRPASETVEKRQFTKTVGSYADKKLIQPTCSFERNFSQSSRRDVVGGQSKQNEVMTTEATVKKDHREMMENSITENAADNQKDLSKRVDHENFNDHVPEKEINENKPLIRTKDSERSVANICDELNKWCSGILPDFKPSAEVTRQILDGKFL
ncbi:unnamed protein product [Schistocephalus solidus]|uniref:CENPCB protein n=1 Tax=Schistocephalus solidus TaxID=70667 RepID=A0A183SRQ5_SCHSO|nr:unnamed protein product [Schistocephalus solidus]